MQSPPGGAVSPPRAYQDTRRLQEILVPFLVTLFKLYNTVWFILEAEYLVHLRSTSLLIHRPESFDTQILGPTAV